MRLTWRSEWPARLLMAALHVVVGSVLGKIRPNWFCGVRTAWTLSSKLSWTRTHRLGGWLMIALGAAEIASALVQPEPSIRGWILLTGGTAVVLATIAYSYLVWCDDPNRQPAITTRPAD